MDKQVTYSYFKNSSELSRVFTNPQVTSLTLNTYFFLLFFPNILNSVGKKLTYENSLNRAVIENEDRVFKNNIPDTYVQLKEYSIKIIGKRTVYLSTTFDKFGINNYQLNPNLKD